jgi:hypothetical protein
MVIKMKKLAFLWLGLAAAASAGIFFLSRSLLTVLYSSLLTAVFFIVASALILLIGWNTEKPSAPKKRRASKKSRVKQSAAETLPDANPDAPTLSPEQEAALAAEKEKAEKKALRREKRRAGLKKTLITTIITLVCAGMIGATILFVFDPFAAPTQDSITTLAYNAAINAVEGEQGISSAKFIDEDDASITHSGSSYYVGGWVSTKNSSGKREKLSFTVYLKYSTQQKVMTVVSCDLGEFSE